MFAPWTATSLREGRRLLSAQRHALATMTAASSQLCGNHQYASCADNLKKENKRLRSVLATFQWPRLETFWARGQCYTLPLHQPTNNSITLSSAPLQYLSGFFDGDGCAAGQSYASSCRLSITQSYDHAEILLHFQKCFGGGIYRGGCQGMGLRKPTLQWILGGASARSAAEQLLPSSCTKRRQLELVANWPNINPDLDDNAFNLRFLKRCDSAVAMDCSWAYCAGFFDADGSILIHRNRSMLLRVSQKHRSVLDVIGSFIEKEMGILKRVYRTATKGFELRISKDSDSRQVLQRLLNAGLKRKAEQARLAMDATPQTYGCVREAFAELGGNQQFGKCLDEVGIQRANMIRRLQQRAKYRSKRRQHQEAVAIFDEIQELKSEHERHKAQLENQKLCDYLEMLESLRRNGWPTATAQVSSPMGEPT